MSQSGRPYWICSFSNNQWAVEEEVGKNWDESSFYLAMRSDACNLTKRRDMRHLFIAPLKVDFFETTLMLSVLIIFPFLFLLFFL